MPDTNPTSPLPSLDDMLHSLLLIEEGEHEFSGEEEDVQELRQLFFPITRQSVYLNHAANGPLPRPVARTLHTYIDDTSEFGSINFPRWWGYVRSGQRRLGALLVRGLDSMVPNARTTRWLLRVYATLR